MVSLSWKSKGKISSVRRMLQSRRLDVPPIPPEPVHTHPRRPLQLLECGALIGTATGHLRDTWGDPPFSGPDLSYSLRIGVFICLTFMLINVSVRSLWQRGHKHLCFYSNKVTAMPGFPSWTRSLLRSIFFLEDNVVAAEGHVWNRNFEPGILSPPDTWSLVRPLMTGFQ